MPSIRRAHEALRKPGYLIEGSMRAFISFCTMALLLVAAPASGQEIAATGSFSADSGGTPTSATTTFHLPIWTQGDATNTAHHELLHAIGFAVAYNYFQAHVSDTTREFCDTPTDPCTVLGKLTPANEGTHIDPGAGTVNGYDQSQSVMQPTRVDGLRMDGQEKSILSSAFSWPSKKIKITVNYVGSFDSAQQGYIQDAVNAAQQLFGTADDAAAFVWTVQTDNTGNAGAAVTGKLDRSAITRSIADLDTVGPQRTAAIRAILDGGSAAIRELENAGAKPMSGIAPRPVDVLYTLTTRRLNARIRTNSFGLHLVGGTTRDQVVEMGQRRGFVLREGVKCDPRMSPACYVILKQGQDLLETMASVIKQESLVRNVNFDYFEN
jgi:hypothetical protein